MCQRRIPGRDRQNARCPGMLSYDVPGTTVRSSFRSEVLPTECNVSSSPPRPLGLLNHAAHGVPENVPARGCDPPQVTLRNQREKEKPASKFATCQRVRGCQSACEASALPTELIVPLKTSRLTGQASRAIPSSVPLSLRATAWRSAVLMVWHRSSTTRASWPVTLIAMPSVCWKS